MASTTDQEVDGLEIDPIWTTSRTARQIYVLGEVDKVCVLSFGYSNAAHRCLGYNTSIGAGCIFDLATDSSPDGRTR